MSNKRTWKTKVLAGVAFVVVPSVCFAQNSRLLEQPVPARQAQRPGVVRIGPMNPNFDYPEMVDPGPTLATAGWFAAPPPPPRELRKNDLIKIRVDITARTIQQGETERRKTSNFDAFLRNWVNLEGLSAMRTTPNQNDQPRAQGNLNAQSRALGNQLTSESMKFDITATVADILPNGNIVLEARRKVSNNDEKWLVSLTGICNRDSIQPGGFVLSQDIYDLQVSKEEAGMVKDSYERGWLQKVWDRFKLF